LQAFPLLVAGPVLPLLPSPSSLFIYSSMRDSPPPLFGTQGTLSSLLHVFFVVIADHSVFFPFFPGWGLVCPGGYADLAQGCLWEYCVLLSSPCGPHLPSLLGAGIWQWPGGPPGFSV
jgi:hypothetical protein